MPARLTAPSCLIRSISLFNASASAVWVVLSMLLTDTSIVAATELPPAELLEVLGLGLLKLLLKLLLELQELLELLELLLELLKLLKLAMVLGAGWYGGEYTDVTGAVKNLVQFSACK